MRVYENAKLASQYHPASLDENVPYYQDKLLALLEKFKEFLPKGEAVTPQAQKKGKRRRISEN